MPITMHSIYRVVDARTSTTGAWKAIVFTRAKEGKRLQKLPLEDALPLPEHHLMQRSLMILLSWVLLKEEISHQDQTNSTSCSWESPFSYQSSHCSRGMEAEPVHLESPQKHLPAAAFISVEPRPFSLTRRGCGCVGGK